MSHNENMQNLFQLVNKRENILYTGSKLFLGKFIKEMLPYTFIFIIGDEVDFFKNKEDNTTKTVFFKKEILLDSPNGLKSMITPLLKQIGVEYIILDMDIKNKDLYADILRLAEIGFNFIVINNDSNHVGIESVLRGFNVVKA